MKENLLSTTTRRLLHLSVKARSVLLLCSLAWALASVAQPQQRMTISGTVTDAGGAVVGATVTVKGTTNGTTTQTQGHYSIQAPAGSTLVFGYIGYVSRQVKIDSQTKLDIVLQPDNTLLDEVVVVGYGVQKKSLVTGAISSLKGDQIEKTGIINAGDALAGKVSGVQVISDNGQPGSGVQIVVRGVGSNNSNGNNPIYIVDGMAVDGISYLSTSDIASMEVLKDAASAAIYGARGGNGVVIVTTKRGSEGASSINYNFSYGISNLARKLPLLNANEYCMIRNEMSVNAGQSAQFSDQQMNSFSQGTDWQEALLNRNAVTMQHNISFLGGSKRTTYSLSGSYLDQNGIFAKGKSNYKRYNFSFNGEQKFLRDDVFKVGQNIVFSRVINKDISSNSLLSGPITSALNMDPLTPVYDDYRKYADYQTNSDYYNLYDGYAYSRYMNSDYANPAALVHFTNPNSYWTTAKANIYAELTVLKDFKLRGSMGADMVWTQTYSYTQPRRFNPTTVYNTENGTSQSSSERTILNGDLYLTWSKTICDKHNVTAMAGTQLIQRSGLSISASRDGLLTTDINKAFVSLAKGPNQGASGGPTDPSAMVSFFARANYAYDSRYLFTATIRRDGSSRFGANNRFATFPSASAGWNISNEQFMKNISQVNSLKLRASWGQNGNENIGNFAYLANMSTSSQLGYVFDSNNATAITPGSAPLRIANPNLKWETSEQINVGVDATLFNNWTITADYYVKTTKDLLVTSPVPLFLGNGFPVVNAGNVRNRGFELMVGYNKTFNNGLNLNASANVTFNKNMVTYVGTDSKFVAGMNIGGIGEITRMEQGYPMAYFRGYKVLGVFQNWDQVNNYTYTDPVSGDKKPIQPNAQPGDLKYLDYDSDGVIDSKDKTMIGNPYPTAVFGINVTASWKNFDLTINAAGATGQDVFSAVRRVQSPNNWGKWALERWTGEGTSNTIPRLTDADTNGNWSNSSDLYIQPGDYFRIRNLALGYTLKAAPKYYIRSIRVFVSVNNLYTFTKYNRGYDPEIGAQNPLSVGTDLGNYPRPRMLSMGVNLTF